MKKSTITFKLLLVFCFQLVVIIALAMFANLLIQRMGDSSANILKNNLSSVECCANMNRALSGLRANPDQLQLRTEFESNLQAELSATSEIGEKEIAEDLKIEYFKWIRTPSDTTVLRTIRGNLRSINEMNISAMRIKEMETREMASHASTYIIVISALISLVSLLFTFIFIGRMVHSSSAVVPPVERT